jgi:putative MATE family efflux protein
LRETEFLGTDPVGTLLFRLSLPAIVGMSVQASYNLADAFFIGRGVGPLGLAGTVAAFPLQLFAIGIGSMGGAGTASLVSRSLGAGDPGRANRALGTLMTLALSAGITSTFLGRLALLPLLGLLGARGEVVPFAAEYMAVLLFGLPLQILGLGLSSVLRAEGNARSPMAAMVVSAVTNTILDAFFIFGLKWGVAGAAWATVISQGLVVCWLGIHLMSGKSTLKLKTVDLAPEPGLAREIVTVGFSELAELTAASFMVAVVVHSMALYGSPLAVAAYGVVNRILSFAYLPLFGVAQGLQPVLGFNYGAGLWSRTRKAILVSAISAGAVSFAAFLILQLLAGPIFGIFTDSPEFRELGVRSLKTMTLGFFCVGFHIIGASLFRALGKALPALFLSLSAEVILFLPLVLVLPRFWGLWGLWLSYPASDVLSALVTGVVSLRQLKELKKREKAGA